MEPELSRTFTFTYLPDLMLKDERIDLYDMATAMGIAFYVDKNRVSWPGKKKIAKIARISERKVQECINNLEKYGYLTVERRKEPDNQMKNLSNLYLLHDIPQAQQGGGAACARGVGQRVPEGGARHAPELYPINKKQESKQAAKKEAGKKKPTTEKEEKAMEILNNYGIADNHKTRENLRKAITAGVIDFSAFLCYIRGRRPDARTPLIINLIAELAADYVAELKQEKYEENRISETKDFSEKFREWRRLAEADAKKAETKQAAHRLFSMFQEPEHVREA